MNLEEKIEHLRVTSMEEARAKGNAIIENYTSTLEDLFNKHCEETMRQSEIRVKSEANSARLKLNQISSKAQIELKRELSKVQNDLKEELFQEVRTMLADYMSAPAYVDLLCDYINQAAHFADGQAMTIYINPDDADKKEELESRTGMTLTVSRENFIGGIRAVIQEKNILIDHSFKDAIASEYDKFSFKGGADLA